MSTTDGQSLSRYKLTCERGWIYAKYELCSLFIYKEFLFHQTHGLTRYQNYFREILFSVGATTNKMINSKMYVPTLRLSFFIDLQFVHFYADFVLEKLYQK